MFSAVAVVAVIELFSLRVLSLSLSLASSSLVGRVIVSPSSFLDKTLFYRSHSSPWKFGFSLLPCSRLLSPLLQEIWEPSLQPRLQLPCTIVAGSRVQLFACLFVCLFAVWLVCVFGCLQTLLCVCVFLSLSLSVFPQQLLVRCDTWAGCGHHHSHLLQWRHLLLY